LATVESTIDDSAKMGIEMMRKIDARCKTFETNVETALAAVTVDLDGMRARVDATHGIITGWHLVESTMTAKISAMRLDMGDMQEHFQHNDTWMKYASESFQQIQKKEERVTADVDKLMKSLPSLKNDIHNEFMARIENELNTNRGTNSETIYGHINNLRREMNAKLDTKVDTSGINSMEDINNLRLEMNAKLDTKVDTSGINSVEDINNLRREMNAKFDTKVDTLSWKWADINKLKNEMNAQLESKVDKVELESKVDKAEWNEGNEAVISILESKVDMADWNTQGKVGSEADIIKLGNDLNALLESKVDKVDWNVGNDDLEASVSAVRNIASSSRFDSDERWLMVNEMLDGFRHDLTVVEAHTQELIAASLESDLLEVPAVRTNFDQAAANVVEDSEDDFQEALESPRSAGEAPHCLTHEVIIERKAASSSAVVAALPSAAATAAAPAPLSPRTVTVTKAVVMPAAEAGVVTALKRPDDVFECYEDITSAQHGLTSAQLREHDERTSPTPEHVQHGMMESEKEDFKRQFLLNLQKFMEEGASKTEAAARALKEMQSHSYPAAAYSHIRSGLRELSAPVQIPQATSELTKILQNRSGEGIRIPSTLGSEDAESQNRRP